MSICWRLDKVDVSVEVSHSFSPVCNSNIIWNLTFNALILRKATILLNLCQWVLNQIRQCCALQQLNDANHVSDRLLINRVMSRKELKAAYKQVIQRVRCSLKAFILFPPFHHVYALLKYEDPHDQNPLLRNRSVVSKKNSSAVFQSCESFTWLNRYKPETVL